MDIMYVMIFLFLFAMSTLIAFTVWEAYKENIADTDIGSSSVQASIEENADLTLANMDYLFVFILVGLTIILVISVFFLKSHPAFFWITLLLLVIFLLIAGVISNVYEEIGETSVLSAANAEYNIMEWVFDRLPTFILFITALVLIALYAKSRFMDMSY